jgi:hypothetical protein
MKARKPASHANKRKPAKQPARRAPAQPSTKSTIAPGEHVRTVPLHYPKPTFAIRDVATADLGSAATDPFDGKAHVAPADALLTYRGGRLLQNVQVFAIFWGTLWKSSASAPAVIAQINQFFQDILVSPLIDQLAEYNAGTQKIGHGLFTGSAVITDAAPVGSVGDATIQTQLLKWIKAKVLSPPTANTLYFIYLDPGIVSVMGGSKSCQSYCGYHNNVGAVYYAVMPYPSCAGCLGGMVAIDAITGTTSHELCESITDPVPGTGWYDDKNGEIGDICAWNFKQVAGHTVQLEWSNAQKRCV